MATMAGPCVTVIAGVVMANLQYDARLMAVGLGGIVLLWGVAMYFWVRRWIGESIEPIDRLADHIERIVAIDDLDRYRVPMRTNDAVGRLARCIQSAEDRLAIQFGVLKDNYRKMSVLMRTMDEVIIAVDGERRLIFGNLAAEEMFDFDATRMIGQPALQIIRHRVFEQVIDECLESGSAVRTEMTTSDPTKRCLSIRATSFSGPSTSQGVLMVLHDISELRRLENLRREFVANVSHELKTPLSSIKAYAETLRIGAINDADHNLRFVEQIETQADRLQALIGDMLQIARVESGEEAFEITSVSLPELVEQCQRNHEGTARAKQIQIVIHPPNAEGGRPDDTNVTRGESTIRVMADREGVRTILDNLVGNAITYTPAGGQIAISWRRESSDHEMAVIEVSDSGIGINPEDQLRIFERFYRVDRARSREIGGTGLGLSIVKHLSQAFGGSVSLQSSPGEGSKFLVSLPIANHLAADIKAD